MVVCDHVEGVVSAPHGPFYGPLAHGFACGAHLPAHTSRPWNALDDPVRDHDASRAALAEDWGVTTPQDWARQVEYLLGGTNVGPEVDPVLDVRTALLRRRGHYDLLTWQNAIGEQWRAPGEADRMVHLAGVVTRYESRFRTDGLLPQDGVVTSVAGYDFGRAVTLARRGFGGGFCDRPAAEWIVLRAGELCRERYTSWAGFSAGYALGRVVLLDDERYGHGYASVLRSHRLLTADRSSPWCHLPFR